MSWNACVRPGATNRGWAVRHRARTRAGVRWAAPLALLGLVLQPSTLAAGAATPSVATLPWSLGSPTKADLLAVSCPNTGCIGVGYTQQGAGPTIPIAAIQSGSTWTLEQLPEPTGGFDMELTSISCTSSMSCVAAGDVLIGSSSLPVAETLSASHWSASVLPVLPGTTSYSGARGVQCFTAGCIAVGYDDTAAGDVPLIETQSDGAWVASTVSFPPSDTSASLSQVACVDPADCTAIGTASATSSTPFVAVDTGGSWTSAAAPAPSDLADVSFTSISCWAASACEAVASAQDSGVAVSLSGTSATYTTVPSPSDDTFEQLNAIACTAVATCVATGRGGSLSGQAAVAATLDGSSWSVVTIAGPSNDNEVDLDGVACSATGHCSAVGSVGMSSDQSESAFFATLSGSAWSTSVEVADGPPNASLYGVACPSTSACYGVGMYESLSGADKPFVETYTRGAWALQLIPMPHGAVAAGLFGIACTSATKCEAVGSFLAPGGPGATSYVLEPYAEQLAHGKWASVRVASPKTATGAGLDGVSCPSPTTCYAVGVWSNASSLQQPFEAKFVGTRWSTTPIKAPAAEIRPVLVSISCWAVGRCVAVGTYFKDKNFFGDIETLTKTTWKASTASAPSGGVWTELQGVSCASATLCVAVGNYEAGNSQYPLIERLDASGQWAGSTPFDTTTPMWGSFDGVDCLAAACVAVGTNGTDAIEARSQGTGWGTSALGEPAGYVYANLFAVSCRSASCIAVGQAIDGNGGAVPAIANP